jgi:hypothetical protein
MAHYFFPSTRVATKQITELFDFVWPTAAALWNLRWQVIGFLQEVPSATPVQLNDRFVFGSSIHGTNLKRACVQTTWEAQKHHLSMILLTNAFAAYEHWADEILASVGMTGDKGKRLQFDDGPTGTGGLCGTVRSICSPESRILKAAYYPILSKSPKYSWPLIKNMIACYRFFKELRNSQIHNGGVANKQVELAYRAFAPVSNKAALGMKGDLIHDPISEGDKITLHIRGVVGFCDILFRMMVTVDAELCRSIKAEAVLEKAIRGAKRPSTFSGNPQRRHAQVIQCCKSVALPKPADVKLIGQFLVSKGLVSN